VTSDAENEPLRRRLRFWKWNVPLWAWLFLFPAVVLAVVLGAVILVISTLINPRGGLDRLAAIALVAAVALYVAGHASWGSVAAAACVVAALGWWLHDGRKLVRSGRSDS
jgi:hypothetical protein